MTSKEETLRALKDLIAKQDYSNVARIISSERLEEQFHKISDDLSFEMNGVFAFMYWGLNKFKDALRICSRMLAYFEKDERREHDEYLISGIVRLKHSILMALGHKVEAYFFLKRNLDLLSEDDAVELRMWYQKSKEYLVDTYYVRIAYTLAAIFFLYSAADYYFDLLDSPYSIIVSSILFILAMFAFRKTGFVPFILNRIF